MRKIFLITLIYLVLAVPCQSFAFTPTHQFTDQEKDFEIGLYNYGAREYDPSIGRFIQEDPLIKDPKVLPDGSINPNFLMTASQQEMNDFLANPQNLNPYAYVRNNPINYIDPTGEEAYDVTTDIYFFDQDLKDYMQNKSLGNALALGVDTLALLPIIPGGTGHLFKNFFKSIDYLHDWYKEVKLLAKFRVEEKEIRSIIKNADNAYEVAKNGGQNANFLRDYLNKSKDELNKGIKSLENNVKEHIDKINNPNKYIENFSSVDERYIQGNIDKWKKDIVRNQEQRNILMGILRERK